MASKDLTQKVIDFQFSRIHMKDEGQHHIFDEKFENQRFSDWNLNNIIHSLGLTQQNQYNVKWVGHEQISYVDAFIYCLFQGCRNSLAAKNGTFIKLKYNIYQLSAKFLKINDQKLIVQTLCSAQYAKNLVNFLNRNKILQSLFQKLVKCLTDFQKSSFSSQLEELKVFAKTFNFIKFEIINESIGLMHHVNKRFYIIREKGCYFIVEVQTEKHKIMELKRIVQNDNQQQQSSIPEDKMLPAFHQSEQLLNNKEQIGWEYPKKIYQYAAPKFILKNGVPKKNKKQPRYTEVQIQEDFLSQFRKLSPNMKTKTVDPSLISRNDYLLSEVKQTKYDQFRKSINPNRSNHENPEHESKTHSKQKMKQRRVQLRERAKRVKTGFIQISGDMRKALLKNQSNSKSKSHHDITFDDKQIKRNNFKKIQLNLKHLTKSRSKNKEGHDVSSKKIQKINHYNHQFSHNINNNGSGLSINQNMNHPTSSLQSHHQYEYMSSHVIGVKSLTPTHNSTRTSIKTAFTHYNGY